MWTQLVIVFTRSIRSGALAIGLISSGAWAENIQQIPERVELDSSGKFSVVTRPAQSGEQLPKEVSVVSVGEGGQHSPGVWLAGRDAITGLFSSVDEPVALILDAERGVFEVETWIVRGDECWGRLGRLPTQAERARINPSKRMLHGSDCIPVFSSREERMAARPRVEASPRGGWALMWLNEINTFPADNATRDLILASQSRIQRYFEQLLGNNAGFARIVFRFDAIGPPGMLAQTDPRESTVDTYAQVRTNLRNFIAKDAEPAVEVILYDALPPNATLPVIYQGDVTSQTSKIVVVAAMVGKWGLAVPPDNDATMTINSASMFDFNADDPVDPNLSDFEATLAHEVIHALGFRSWTEGTPRDRVTLWDLFRLGRDAVGATASSTEMQTSPRVIQIGTEAVSVTRLNDASALFRMSTGLPLPGNGAGHWKFEGLLAKEVPPGTWIGLMDPLSSRTVPGYLAASDKMALDTMGWNMEPNGPPQPPAQPQPQQPLDDQQNLPLQPQLQWVPGAGASSHNVNVYCGMVPNSQLIVHQVIGVTGKRLRCRPMCSSTTPSTHGL